MAPTVFLLRRSISDVWKWNVDVSRWAARVHLCFLTRCKCVTAPPAGDGQVSADSCRREVGLLLLTPAWVHILRKDAQGDSSPMVEIWEGMLTIQEQQGDFPGGPVVKNPPCNAGDSSSILGWGTKIPCAKEHLNPRAATMEPACYN